MRPLKVRGGDAHTYSLVIVGGNTLSDGVTDGIVYEAGGLTDVPSIYDPDVDTTFLDGIGRAILYIDNIAQSNYVLVAHYAGNGGGYMRALYADQEIGTSANTTTLPLSGDPTQSVTLYVPAR